MDFIPQQEKMYSTLLYSALYYVHFVSNSAGLCTNPLWPQRSVRPLWHAQYRLRSHLLQLGKQVWLLTLLQLALPSPPDHLTNYIFINSSTSSWVVGWLSKSSLSLSLCPLWLCQDTRHCLARHPTASLGSSPQFLPSRVYKHRPQESTWWAKNCEGKERERQKR